MSKILLNNERKKRNININSFPEFTTNKSEHPEEMLYKQDTSDDLLDDEQNYLLKILDKKYVDLKKSGMKKKPNKTYPDEQTKNTEDKIEIIDKIIKMFPDMKNQRKIILSEILNPKQQPDDGYILEKITVNERVYYKDKYKNIIDENTNLVGIWEINKEGNYVYHIFEYEKIDTSDFKKYELN